MTYTDEMLETILIYLSITLVLYLAAKTAAIKNDYRYVIWGIAFYALIMGMRYGVGRDYFAYLEMYTDATHGEFQERIEFGWNWYMQFLALINAPQWVFFGLVAFAQLFFIFYSRRENIEVYPFIVLTFMFSSIWLTYANGLRQQLAFCILTLGIPCINETNLSKGFIKYLIIIGIAFCFHKSAILTLLFFPLFRAKTGYIKWIALEYILVFIAVIYSNTGIATLVSSKVEGLLTFFEYDYYLDNSASDNLNKTIERVGIGYYVHLLIIVILIAESNSVKEYFKSHAVNIIYDLTFIGFILKYIFIDSIAFARINYYFIGFQFIFSAYCFYYLKQSQKMTIFYMLLSLYSLIFVATMYKMKEYTAFFQFFWNVI